MKIAIVLNTSWNIYNFRLNLVKALLEKGHEVIAIAPKDEYSSKLIEAGCKYEEVKMDSRGANPLKDIALTFELYRIYKSRRPDVILQYTIKPNIYGTFAASALKIPVINNVCGLGTAFLNKNLVSKIALELYKLAFRFSKQVYFQNNEDKEFFISSNIIERTKADLLPGSGVDFKRFVPSINNTNNAPFTFLLISRLIHDKGILEYIDAVKILKSEGVNAKFQILGRIDEKHARGIKKELIDDWINEDVVQYLGSTDDVRPFINNADCIVLPSYREGTARSLLEAASSAKPIVTTDVAGCNNIVQHNVNGFLCESKNAKDLAEKMGDMLTLDKNLLDKMGKEGRKIIECGFGEKIVIDKYLTSIYIV